MTVNLYPVKPILLVDDEAPWLRSLSLSLREAAGITNLIKCTDSREVLKIVRESDVILILLDLTMPNFSGRDLLTMLGRRSHEEQLETCNGKHHGQGFYHAYHREPPAPQKGADGSADERGNGEKRRKGRNRVQAADVPQEPGSGIDQDEERRDC